MALLTDATPAHMFGNMKDPLVSQTTMLPSSITPDTASRGLRTMARWNVIRLQMSELLPSTLPDCQSFHLQGPRIVCPFADPFYGFKSIFGQSSGFTTDSPAPESTVISRYRPRSASVATGRSAVDGHVANRDCVQVHLLELPTLHHRSCRSVGLLLHWRCHTVARSLTDVSTLPT